MNCDMTLTSYMYTIMACDAAAKLALTVLIGVDNAMPSTARVLLVEVAKEGPDGGTVLWNMWQPRT